MRQIKFRGKTPEGKFVYGDFVQHGPSENKPGIIDDEGFYREVDPDTVAQLVGCDKNGKEVYEGDTVIEKYFDGEVHERIACFKNMTQVSEDAEYCFSSYPAPYITLKEDDK